MLRFQDMDIDLTQRKNIFAWIIWLTFLAALVYAIYSILAPFTHALLWAGVFACLLIPLQRNLATWITSDGARAAAACLCCREVGRLLSIQSVPHPATRPASPRSSHQRGFWDDP